MAKAYVSYLDMGGVVGYFRETISGEGPPTESTEGFAGLRYYDTAGKTEYVCVSDEGGYTWELRTGGAATAWMLSVRVTTPENGVVVAELYKDGVLCTDRMYLKVYVSSGGGDWCAHGTGTGYFTGTKTWNYGGRADGVAWKCVVYADDTMSEALAAGTAATGTDGHTPVKGTDYYTEADKAEMVNAVLAALPAWEGGSY